MRKLLKLTKHVQGSSALSLALIGIAFFVVLFAYALGFEDHWGAKFGESVLMDRAREIQGLGDQDIDGPFEVADVVDGDTLKVRVGEEVETVRLIGIDTPETNHPRVGVECYGREATAELVRLVGGKQVYLEADPTQAERDRYGRLLRYVYVVANMDALTNINEAMLAGGFAYEYTYDKPYVYQADFKAAELYAREHNSGLWGAACAE